MTRNEYEVSVDSLDKEKVVVIVGRFFSFFPPPGRKLVVIDCYLCDNLIIAALVQEDAVQPRDLEGPSVCNQLIRWDKKG